MVKLALQRRKQQSQDEKGAGGVFRDFGKDRSRARAKQRVGRASTKRQAGAGFFLRKLNEDQEDQDYTIQHH